MNNELREQVMQLLDDSEGCYYDKTADELITLIRTATLDDIKITRLMILAVKHCHRFDYDWDEIIEICEAIDNLRGTDDD